MRARFTFTLAVLASLIVITPASGAKVTRSILKTYFQTGDKPTQEQFATLIDSIVNLADDRYLLGLKVYEPLVPYLPGDTVVAKRFGIGDTTPASPLGYLDPHTYNIPLEPDFNGQWGFLPILLGNTTGQSYYGYLQLWMDPSPPAGGGAAGVSEPPGIHVEYLAYNDVPGETLELTAIPEPAALSLCALAALALRRRR